jgi:hypothetical protein
MKFFITLIIFVMVIALSTAISIKTANHLIKAVDPLAQQIMVLDQTKSPEIVKIKGELVRDLVKNYYNHQDSIKKVYEKNR